MKQCCCCDMRQGVIVSNSVMISLNTMIAILLVVFGALAGDSPQICAEFCEKSTVLISDPNYNPSDPYKTNYNEFIGANNCTMASCAWEDFPNLCQDDKETFVSEYQGTKVDQIWYTSQPDSNACKQKVYAQSDGAKSNQLIQSIFFFILTFVAGPLGIAGAQCYQPNLLIFPIFWVSLYSFLIFVFGLMAAAKSMEFENTMAAGFGIVVMALSDVLYVWLAFGTFNLFKMFKSGSMTKQNYNSQKKACCGASTAVVRPAQPQIIQAAVVSSPATVIQASVVQPTVVQATVVQATVVQATVVQASVVKGA